MVHHILKVVAHLKQRELKQVRDLTLVRNLTESSFQRATSTQEPGQNRGVFQDVVPTQGTAHVVDPLVEGLACSLCPVLPQSLVVLVFANQQKQGSRDVLQLAF